MEDRRTSIRRLGTMAAGALLAGGAARDANATAEPASGAAGGEERVVYHVNDTAFARDALTNMNNHLNNASGAKLALVANGRGVKMLVQGEWDRHGEYAADMKALQARGARFVACRTAMAMQDIDASRLVAGVTSVPSGVVELTRLQTAERYAYIKP